MTDINSHTIYDVARLSGVSIATVSRVFSTPERVKEDKRKRVYAAAEALNYQPSAIARAMALQQTNKIAYIVSKKGASFLDEFYIGICEGVMRKANGDAYQVLISTEVDWENTAQSKQIEGVILAGDAQPAFIAEFQKQDIPVVLANNRAEGFDLPCVVADEKDGVKQAVNHLIAKGHRKIAMLAGRFSAYITSVRYNAFISVMEQNGLPADGAGVVMCDHNIDSATDAATELLNRAERPSAIFAFNDILAAGVYKAAKRLGIKIPKELAVVGFDDSQICRLLEPELTSVHIDCRRMGELCMEHMTALLQGEKNIPRLSVVPVSLCIRGSA